MQFGAKPLFENISAKFGDICSSNQLSIPEDMDKQAFKTQRTIKF